MSSKTDELMWACFFTLYMGMIKPKVERVRLKPFYIGTTITFGTLEENECVISCWEYIVK